jgi:hypothetical protein
MILSSVEKHVWRKEVQAVEVVIKGAEAAELAEAQPVRLQAKTEAQQQLVVEQAKRQEQPNRIGHALRPRRNDPIAEADRDRTAKWSPRQHEVREQLQGEAAHGAG